MIKRVVAASFLIGGLAGTPSAMAQNDPADIGLWTMVERSNTAADYQTYLQIFPNGKFAPLARLRLQSGLVQPAPQPQPQPLTQVQPQPQQDPDEPQFSVTPVSARVGQRFTVNCGTLPTGGRADVIQVVPAGSPVTQGNGTQGITMDYLSNCQRANGDGTFQLGPLPPGRWEFRWMTTLYNLENRYEMKAKVEVAVR